VNAWAVTRLALSRIAAAKTRSLLTMLGVIIGVASLVALTSVASGATSGINESFSALGARQVTVSGQGGRALTERDADALRTLPGVADVATSSSSTTTVVHDGADREVTILGVSPGYAAVQSPEVAYGTFLPESDLGRSLVLNAQAATDLGLTAADVGDAVRVDGIPFDLVGVLDDADGFGSGGTAYVSLDTARRMFAATPYVSTITLLAETEEGVDTVQAAADARLRARYGLDADDDARFTLSNQGSLLGTIDTVRSTLSLLLGGIASISLVVGGIGIMNIMLVSVRERTREIGVRRAIGARRSQILGQFVVEAVVLSTLGGVIGLGLGLAVSALVASVGGWAFTISATTIGVALAFSVLVGVVFGVWPARTAARLQPVDALRFE
jgi:putative ABC transport system permease protein